MAKAKGGVYIQRYPFGGESLDPIVALKKGNFPGFPARAPLTGSESESESESGSESESESEGALKKKGGGGGPGGSTRPKLTPQAAEEDNEDGEGNPHRKGQHYIKIAPGKSGSESESSESESQALQAAAIDNITWTKDESYVGLLTKFMKTTTSASPENIPDDFFSPDPNDNVILRPNGGKETRTFQTKTAMKLLQKFAKKFEDSHRSDLSKPGMTVEAETKLLGEEEDYAESETDAAMDAMEDGGGSTDTNTTVKPTPAKDGGKAGAKATQSRSQREKAVDMLRILIRRGAETRVKQQDVLGVQRAVNKGNRLGLNKAPLVTTHKLTPVSSHRDDGTLVPNKGMLEKGAPLLRQIMGRGEDMPVPRPVGHGSSPHKGIDDVIDLLSRLLNQTQHNKQLQDMRQTLAIPEPCSGESGFPAGSESESESEGESESESESEGESESESGSGGDSDSGGESESEDGSSAPSEDPALKPRPSVRGHQVTPRLPLSEMKSKKKTASSHHSGSGSTHEDDDDDDDDDDKNDDDSSHNHGSRRKHGKHGGHSHGGRSGHSGVHSGSGSSGEDGKDDGPDTDTSSEGESESGGVSKGSSKSSGKNGGKSSDKSSTDSSLYEVIPKTEVDTLTKTIVRLETSMLPSSLAPTGASLGSGPSGTPRLGPGGTPCSRKKGPAKGEPPPQQPGTKLSQLQGLAKTLRNRLAMAQAEQRMLEKTIMKCMFLTIQGVPCDYGGVVPGLPAGSKKGAVGWPDLPPAAALPALKLPTLKVRRRAKLMIFCVAY